MSLYSARNYLLGFRGISDVNIVVQKTWISMDLLTVGIPEFNNAHSGPNVSLITLIQGPMLI